MPTRYHRSRRKINRILLDIDPFLASMFYIGFMVVAVFIVIIYARSLTLEVERQANLQDEKIILAQIAGCARTNETRRAVNRLHNAIDNFAEDLEAGGPLNPSLRTALDKLMDAAYPVRIPNCIIEVRSITGEILRRASEKK